MALLMSTKPHVVEPALADRLIATCREALKHILLAPSVEIRAIDVAVIHTTRFDSTTPNCCYLVTVNTNDATMVRGAVRSYKGSYKERLEAVLERLVKEYDPEGTVHVDIAGPETSTVDRLIPIRSFLQAKKLSSASPIVRTANEHGIEYIQIRGRHLIAPSPAIAQFLERYAKENSKTLRRVADLFAGTAIATKVLLRTASPEKIVLVENDPMKVERIRHHIKDRTVEILEADALEFSFIDKYDLAVADPYYEDVELFLEKQIDNLRRSVRVLLLVPGNVEDVLWNARIRSRLESFHYHVVSHELYGQVIFEAKLSN